MIHTSVACSMDDITLIESYFRISFHARSYNYSLLSLIQNE